MMYTSKNRWAAAGRGLATAAILFVAIGCEDKINSAGFNSISTGMTLGQVEKLLSSKGEKQEVSGVSISGAGIAGGSGTNSQDIYVFKKGMKEISVTLDKDGKVIAKSSAGF